MKRSIQKSNRKRRSPSFNIAEAAGFSVLSAEDERMLLMERGTDAWPAAKERLVMSNMKWLIRIARRWDWLDCEFDDVLQTACIGFIKACERYDQSSGCRLNTYATALVRKQIQKDLMVANRRVHIPSNVYEAIPAVKRARNALCMKGNSDPAPDEIFSELRGQMPRSVFDRALLAANVRFIPAEREKGDDSESVPLEIVSTDEGTEDSCMEASRCKILKEMVADTMNVLNGRERAIVQMRYGISENENEMKPVKQMTFSEIAKRCGINTDAAYRIHDAALKKMKKFLPKSELEQLLL